MRDLELWRRIQQPDALKLEESLLRKAKEFGFSDLQLGHLLGLDETTVRNMRREKGIHPTYKGVDTCGAEFEAYTPYYYSTYEKEDESKGFPEDEDHDSGGRPEPDRPGD